MSEDFDNLPQVDWTRFREQACLLDDYRLDQQVAVTAARRNVAQRHGFLDEAGSWQEALVVLAEVRDDRRGLRNAVDEATFPARDLGELSDEGAVTS